MNRDELLARIAIMIDNPEHYATCGPDCICQELRKLPPIAKALIELKASKARHVDEAV